MTDEQAGRIEGWSQAAMFYYGMILTVAVLAAFISFNT
jgi:hypothetical protein